MNLDTVAQRIQQGRLRADTVITMRSLQEAGLIGKKVSSGVKLLGRVCLVLCSHVATIWAYKAHVAYAMYCFGWLTAADCNFNDCPAFCCINMS